MKTVSAGKTIGNPREYLHLMHSKRYRMSYPQLRFSSFNFLLILIMLLPAFGAFAQVDYYARAKQNLPFMVKDSVVYEQIELDDKGFTMYANPEDKKEGKAEFKVTWDQVPALVNVLDFYSYTQSKEVYLGKEENPFPNFPLSKLPPVIEGGEMPLKGVRIVLDPGHIAGDWETAKEEARFVKIKGKDLGRKEDAKFYEADLAFATAELIRTRLEKLGARVMITRKKGRAALGKSYDRWHKEDWPRVLETYHKDSILNDKDYEYYKNKAPRTRIFPRMYMREELIHRAAEINAFYPDLTLIIHYNTSLSAEKKKDGYSGVVDENFCMMFVGGAFSKNELQEVEGRLNFVRLLFSDFRPSLKFCGHAIQRHNDDLKVPTVPVENNLPYLNKYSVLSLESGVYHRNLRLTRMVKGPICFGESLLQDNRQEALQLVQKDYREGEVVTSKRIKEVADAYYLSILDYFGVEN